MTKTRPWYKRIFRFADQAPVQVENNQPLLIHRQSIGSSGIEIFAGYYSEEYLSTLQGKQAADAYDKMRRADAKIKMVLNAVKNPIKAGTWTVEPADDTPEAKKQSDLIAHILFNDMDKPWVQFLSEALSFIDFGHSVFEVTQKAVLNHPTFGSYNGIQSLGFRSQRTIQRWILDPLTGKLDHIEQWAFGDLSRQVSIPADYLLMFALDKEGDNYEGVSGLRPCFGPYSRKQIYLKLMAIGIEKSAIPTPVASVPDGKENTPQFDAMIEVLKTYTSHQSAYITKPAGWDITFLQNPFDADKVRTAIEFEDKQIVYAFMANFLELGMTTTGGSHALSQSLSHFFLGGIEHISQIIAQGINEKLIPDMVKLNFGNQSAYPKLKVSNVSERVDLDFSVMVKNLVDSKVISPDDNLEAEFRKRIGLPEASIQGRREVAPPKPLFSESEPQALLPSKTVKLADLNPKKLMVQHKDDLVTLMQDNLRAIASGMIDQIIAKFKQTSVSNQANAINSANAKGLQDYRQALIDYFAVVANNAITQARKEVPKAKDVKLAEIDALPVATQKRIKAQAGLLVDTQVSDLEKNISFQYLASQPTTDSAELLTSDMQGAAEDYITGPAILSGSSTLIADVVNQSRNEFFFTDDVSNEIESFTFVNGDPVSPICQDLAGTVFDANDPESQRYLPPLHPNCKSYIVPNLAGNKNPPLTDGGLKPSKSSLDKYVTLSEKGKPSKTKKNSYDFS